jgi:hypothetical protein
MSPTARHYFRMEVCRIWNRRTADLAGAALLATLGLQVAVAFVLHRTAGLGTGPLWAWQLATILGLSSYIGAVVSSSGGWPVPAGVPTWMWTWAVSWGTVVSVVQTAFFFLMPAFLAVGIAGDREQRRTQDLMLAGLRSSELLAAKALAAAFPFLVASLLVAAGELVTFFVVGLPLHHAILAEVRSSGVDSLARLDQLERTLPLWIGGELLSTLTRPVSVLAQVAILACLAALGRRVPNALVLCYGVVIARSFIVSVPLNTLLHLLARGLSAGRGVLRTLLVLSVELGAAWFLWRLAVRSLAFPDEAGIEIPPLPRPPKPHGLWFGPEDS